MIFRAARLFSGVVLTAFVGACGGGGSIEGEPNVIRLQDVFGSANVEGGSEITEQLPRAEWAFNDGGTNGWQAGVGIEDLRVDDGRLAGRTTVDFPALHVERTEGLDRSDALYAVEVRAKVSAGTTLQVWLDSAEELNVEELVEGTFANGWPLATPLLPGEEFQTYRLTTSINLNGGGGDFLASGIRHVLLNPSDQVGAQFEIESIRLIFREEQLAEIPSGVSWQGFENIFKETLITRAPETVNFDLVLPSHPWLDLSIGTVEDRPVTFRVEADDGSEHSIVLQRTITTAERWESAPVDLEQFANQSVNVSLSLISEKPGALGFWGTPSVRNRVTQSSGSDGPPQGVILFVADTLRRDHLDVYGYERETAPMLTRLAGQGALFEDNISQGTWTKVSMPSIHSSLYPSTHGIKSVNDRLPASATTLAEVYRDAGYATLSMSSVAFSGRGTNLHQGFEEVHERGSVDLPETQASKTARTYVDRLIPWLKQHRDGPFFVFIHVFDAHDPYVPFRPYDTRWAAPGALAAYNELVEIVRPFIEDPGRREQGMPNLDQLHLAGVNEEAFVRPEHDWYDGSIRGMNAELARLVEALEQLGLDDDIAMAFIADHGEEFYEHGTPWHDNVYGELSNVPLMLWAPGRISPQRISDVTQSIDLMPTLLELSDLPVPELAQGQSLLPLLSRSNSPSSFDANAQQSWRARPAFTERVRGDFEINRNDPLPDAHSVVLDGFKLVNNFWRPEDSSLPEYQLFDHVNDPLDQIDIAADNPDAVERLSRIMADWRTFAEAARLPADDTTIDSLDPAELERLRSLGYIN